MNTWLESRWMRWLPPLVLVAASLILTLPLWQQDMLWTADGWLHLYRIFELNEQLRQGVLYPRWSDNLYFGYGYPVFHFYSPLSYYIIETFQLLGLTLFAAFKLFFALMFPLAAMGMYVFTRETFTPVLTRTWQLQVAALFAGIAYAASPYLLIDVFVRGATAEMLALALLPFLLWAIRKTILARTWSATAVLAMLLALLITSHNLTTFFAAPILVGFSLLNLFFIPTWQARRTAALRLVVGTLVGLGLSAFYWLPAFFEMPLVYVGQREFANIPLQARMLEHFLPLARVFDFGWLYSYPEAPWSLGLAGIVLAALGLITAWHFLSRARKAEMLFWSGVVAVITFLVTDLAKPLWFQFPSLWIIQFPWRLTVFWSFGIALGVGFLGLFCARILETRPALVWLITLVVILNFLFVGLARFTPRVWQISDTQGISVGIIAREELNSNVPGASYFEPPVAEYLPTTVKQVPMPRPRAQRNASVPNPNPPSIELVSQHNQDWRLNVSAVEPFTLTLRAFYFPDWQATLDNHSATAFPATNFGVVGVRVPAGQHTLSLTRTITSYTQLGLLLTAVSCIAFGALLFFSLRAREREWFVPLALFAVALFLFGLPLLRAAFARPVEMTPTQVELDGNFKSLRVLGYATELGSENILTVHLIWQVVEALTEEQPIELRLVDNAGNVVAERAQLARYGTGWMFGWARGRLAQDRYELALPNELKCEPHFLEIRRGAENIFSRLGAVTISPCPLSPLPSPEFQAVNARFGDNMVLGGIAPATARTFSPGQTAKLILYWRAESALRADYEVTVQLVDRDGKKIAQVDSEPEYGFAPTSLWLRGRWIVDTHEIKIPQDAAPGNVDVRVGVTSAPLKFLPARVNEELQQDDVVTVGTVRIAPLAPREPPTVHLNLAVGDAIQLRGVSGELLNAQNARTRVNGAETLQVHATAAQTLALKLFWERTSAAQIPNDYTVFLHVLNDAGELVTQMDQQPVRGNFPSTQWAQNEIVTDEYEIDLSQLAAGHYQIFAGMYDRANGERLPLQTRAGKILTDARVQVADLVIGK